MAMNELTCTDIVVDKQIKDEFRIYFQPRGSYCDYFSLCRVPAQGKCKNKAGRAELRRMRRRNYDYTIQRLRVEEAGIRPEPLGFHIALRNTALFLPHRYKPKVVKVREVTDASDRRIVDYAFIFKEQCISYLMQKCWQGDYVSDKITLRKMINFFKSICEHTEGIEFDEYIDDWAKRLLQEGGKRQ